MRQSRLTIIRGVFLASDHSLGTEEGSVRADLDVVDNTRLEIHVDRTRNVFSRSGLGKEGREPVLSRFWGVLNTTVGLYVSNGSVVIMKERIGTRTLNPCSRV